MRRLAAVLRDLLGLIGLADSIYTKSDELAGKIERRATRSRLVSFAAVLASCVMFYLGVQAIAEPRSARATSDQGVANARRGIFRKPWPDVWRRRRGAPALGSAVTAPTVVFWCDWRDAADSVSTAAAVANGCSVGDWNAGIVAGLNSNTFVVTAANVPALANWPATKALRWRNTSGVAPGGASQIQVKGDSAGVWADYDTLNVGEQQTHRVYYLVDAPSTVDEGDTHVFETRPTATNFGQYIDTYLLEDSAKVALIFNSIWFDINGGISDPAVKKDTIIVFETQVRRTFVDSAQLSARVWVDNGAGSFSIVYSDVNFVQRFGGGNTLADSLNYFFTGWSELQRMRFGMPGYETNLGVLYNYAYAGNVAICKVTWCGLYPISGVEN